MIMETLCGVSRASPSFGFLPLCLNLRPVSVRNVLRQGNCHTHKKAIQGCNFYPYQLLIAPSFLISRQQIFRYELIFRIRYQNGSGYQRVIQPALLANLLCVKIASVPICLLLAGGSPLTSSPLRSFWLCISKQQNGQNRTAASKTKKNLFACSSQNSTVSSCPTKKGECSRSRCIRKYPEPLIIA